MAQDTQIRSNGRPTALGLAAIVCASMLPHASAAQNTAHPPQSDPQLVQVLVVIVGQQGAAQCPEVGCSLLYIEVHLSGHCVGHYFGVIRSAPVVNAALYLPFGGGPGMP